jgi:glycosyltransferase involved in cell wall biosynthesis
MSMKIGIVIFTDDAQIGGAVTYIQQILQGLMKKAAGCRHSFCLIGKGEQKPGYLADIDLRWISLRREELAQPPASDVEYYPEVNREEFDLLCYLHPWSHWICPIRDIPYFSNVWDLQHRLQPFFPEVTSFGEFDRRQGMYRRALERAACIIASNEVGKREIVSLFQVAPERVRAIEHPTPEFALNARESKAKDTLSRLGIGKSYLFYPAQFWPHKNHILLLLMLQQLRQKHRQDLELVLTGSDRGNQTYIRQKIQELGLENRVRFVGFVSQEDLITLYRKAVALVFPSFFGPENLPPLEAFALGCPVIASDVAGAKEQMGDAAILVDPKRPELWSQAVLRLRRDWLLRQTLIVKGKKRARKFRQEDFARELLNLFDEFALYRRTWASSEDKIKFVAL